MKTNHVRILTVAVASALLVVGCAGIAEEFRAFGIGGEFVANHDASRMAIQAIEADTLPEDDEYFAGRLAASQILERYDVYGDPEANRYVNLLGQTLALASDRPVIYSGYRFMILDSEEINGLATPGGHVFVTRGLLRLARSEDEVAAILAHEISHVAYRHGAKAIMETRGRNLALRAEALNYRLAAVRLDESALGRATGVVEQRVQSVINSLLGDGYSQEAEVEADLGAVQILLKLGYDPYAMVRVLDRLADSERFAGLDKKGFHQTHPNPRRRIREIERRLTSYGGLTTVNQQVAGRRYQSALNGI